MKRPHKLAVGKRVRAGDLARVWDGTRWRDGRVRHVTDCSGHTEFDIMYEGCGCEGTIQRGQCRHSFQGSDCGTLWIRDCQSLRWQRRKEAAAAAARSEEEFFQPATTAAPPPSTKKWPTAKFHQPLKKKSRPSPEQPIRPRDLPSQTPYNEAATPSRTYRRRHRIPNWRWQRDETTILEPSLGKSDTDLSSSGQETDTQEEAPTGAELSDDTTNRDVEADQEVILTASGCDAQPTAKSKNRKRKEQRHASWVLTLEAYEWARLTANGVLWVEQGPAQLLLPADTTLVSGPHTRLDRPTNLGQHHLYNIFLEEP